jgi:hypothetical protein
MGHYSDFYEADERAQQLERDKLNRQTIDKFLENAESYQLRMLKKICNNFDHWYGFFRLLGK